MESGPVNVSFMVTISETLPEQEIINKIADKFATFLASLLEDYGPQGIVECFSFLLGAFEISQDGVVIAATDSFLEMTKYPRSELIGMRAVDLIAEDERGAMLKRFKEENTAVYNLKLLQKNGKLLDVLVNPRTFTMACKKYRLAEIFDNSIHIRFANYQIESAQKFDSIFEQAAVGIAQVSVSGVFLEVNHKLCDILGYSKAELLTKNFREVTYPDDLDTGLQYVGQLLRNEISSFSTEKRYIGKHGNIVWVNLTVSLASSADGMPKYFVCILEDICARKIMETELVNRATHDALTGLFNRIELAKTLQNELVRAHRYAKPFSLFMIDIDHFKRINDNYGHQAGDEVLITLARIMIEEVREADAVGRFGGEEFLVILPELNHQQALILAERIRKQVESQHINTQNGIVKITISIGVATYLEHGQDAEQLVKAADEAMYKAKSEGRNRVVSAG